MAKEVIKILLVGNSYTYKNGFGQILSKLGRATGKDLLVVRATKGGVSIDTLLTAKLSYKCWRNGKRTLYGKKGKELILDEILKKPFKCKAKTGKWDYIVIQNNSTVEKTGTGDRKAFNKLIKYIPKKNSSHFFITSMHFGKSLTKTGRYNAHLAAAKELHCGFIDVRGFFARYPNIFTGRDWYTDLTIEDNDCHPSPRGMYIRALATYCAIFGSKELSDKSSNPTTFIQLYTKKGDAYSGKLVTDKKDPPKNDRGKKLDKNAVIKLQYLVRKYNKDFNKRF